MATHSSTLVWKMTWAAEPGRLHPKGYKESDMTEHMAHPEVELLNRVVILASIF